MARGSAAVLGVVALVIALGGHLADRPEQPGRPRHHRRPCSRASVTFLLRNCGIGLVVAGVALRYFFVTHEWRRNIEMQAQARVHALQARIRPLPCSTAP